jgi:hypothetical protein
MHRADNSAGLVRTVRVKKKYRTPCAVKAPPDIDQDELKIVRSLEVRIRNGKPRARIRKLHTCFG